MRYFFDIMDGDQWARDDLGIDCASDERARYQAVLALTELAHEELPGNGSSRKFSIRVREASGTAFTVHLEFDTTRG